VWSSSEAGQSCRQHHSCHDLLQPLLLLLEALAASCSSCRIAGIRIPRLDQTLKMFRCGCKKCWSSIRLLLLPPLLLLLLRGQQQ
jgi:hypothetical protein